MIWFLRTRLAGPRKVAAGFYQVLLVLAVVQEWRVIFFRLRNQHTERFGT